MLTFPGIAYEAEDILRKRHGRPLRTTLYRQLERQHGCRHVRIRRDRQQQGEYTEDVAARMSYRGQAYQGRELTDRSRKDKSILQIQMLTFYLQFTGEIYYVDVDNSDGWWQFPIPNVRIGANQTLKCNGKCLPAIADTGTSLLYLDYNVVTAYYNNVAGSNYSSETGAYIYPCDSTPPDLALDIGGHFFTIKGEEMTYLAFTGNADGGQPGQCLGGLQAGPGGMQIIGDVFLKQIFAVFDGGNMRFGVAEQN